MSSQQLQNLVNKYQNIEALMYKIDYAHFQTYVDMENYLGSAENDLMHKIQELQQKEQMVREEYIRTSSTYQLNNKKRQKEEELLRIERDRIKSQLDSHRERLKVQISPITLVLKEKQRQIEKFTEAGEIISDFHKLVQGNAEEIQRLIPLDQKNFQKSARRIYILKTITDDYTGQQYATAKTQIRKKFLELKTKIIMNFKEGFWKKDKRLVNSILPKCEEYDLLDELSDFYSEQAFRQSYKIMKISSEKEGPSQIKNFFFLLQRGFHYAYGETQIDSDETNFFAIHQMLGKYSETISRRLITFAFQKLIKESMENVFKQAFSSISELNYLYIFYTECKKLLKNVQPLIKDDRIGHLMSTYFQSTFDSYLESYLSIELKSIVKIYEQCIDQILGEVKIVQQMQEQLYTPQRAQNKFSIKKLMDYKLQQPKVNNIQYTKAKIKNIANIFMSVAMERFFKQTQVSLQRNKNIAKINEKDKNMTEILTKFLEYFWQLTEQLIVEIRSLVPSYGDNTVPLEHDFFQVIPQINNLIQRMEVLYLNYKKESSYQFKEALALEQRKENILANCEKDLNQVIGEALANILTFQNRILKDNRNQYMETASQKNSTTSSCGKLIAFLEKYLRVINKISLTSYKNSILRSLGLQFVGLLIKHYSNVLFNRDSLGSVFIDVANYKKVVSQIKLEEVTQKYNALTSLIDIYVIGSDDKTMANYLKTVKETNLKDEKNDIINAYIENKARNAKN